MVIFWPEPSGFPESSSGKEAILLSPSVPFPSLISQLLLYLGGKEKELLSDFLKPQMIVIRSSCVQKHSRTFMPQTWNDLQSNPPGSYTLFFSFLHRYSGSKPFGRITESSNSTWMSSLISSLSRKIQI